MNYENLKLSETQEIWVQITDKIVPYIRPHYYISNWGRIGSMASGTFQLLSLAKDSDGYLVVCLHLYLNIIDDIGHARRQINKRVNRLVMMSFYPIPENYMELEVNHINSIRDDNHLWNLEWTTARDNVLHSLKIGFRENQDISGSKNPMSKLTEEDVYKIVELAKTGLYAYSEIGKIFGVQDNAISNILNKKSWTHLNLDISEDDIYNMKNNGIKSRNMINDKEFIIYNPFTLEEMNKICEFFESTDINDRTKYPSQIDILKDCFYSLNLDLKYNFESKRKTLSRLLDKSRKCHDFITSKYNYNFIR